MKGINKKIITLCLVFMLAFSPIFAIPAQAQWIDISTMAKDYGLDALAFQIVNTIIKRISASTINWINSGFKGNPAYVTDPNAYFGNIADNVVGNFVFGPNSKLNFLCGPIQAKIRIALTKNYLGDNDLWRCSLTRVGENMEDFMSDFEKGGWDSFFEISQRTTMNPIGAYLQAENEMYAQVATRQGIIQTELNQGRGFLSYKKCKPESVRKSEPGPGGLGDCETAYNSCIRWANGNPATAEAERGKCSATLKSCSAKYADVAVGDCAESDKETVTPGSVISDKLNSVLGQSEGRLVMADEINEMISALISQLTEKLIGGAIGGLRGLSNKDSANNNQTFTEQLGTDTSATDYFGNEPDTSVLDVPIPVDTLSTTKPLDNDCNVLSPQEILQAAVAIRDSIPGPSDMKPTLEETIRDMDCEPSGIH